jgi:EAL domain-containing protein (putative c-di-GMP-specific phosphodiesterase class I)
MYRAKEKGRARLELFDPRMRMRVRERLDRRQELGKALGRALERDELTLLYQPLVELDTGAVVGAEALLRWQRPGHGLVGPSGFLRLASDTGLIVPIDAWVLETACARLQRWSEAVPGREVRMSVNQSARSLASPAMLDHLRGVLSGNGCRADAMTLDLSETALGDLDAVRPLLDELCASGVHLALDDVTMGPASLDRLRRIPADTLKIKRSLVANLVDDGYDAAVVTAVAQTAAALGHTVVAKGVETIEQARMARRRGCALAQGFLFSGPISGDRFTELLRSGSRYCID